MTTVFDKPLNGYRFVDTQFGDTLQKIAARELGDAARWGDLIVFNNLVPPYLTDDPTQVTKGVLLTGSQILVPAGAPVISTATDPTTVFQIDLQLLPVFGTGAVGGLLQVANGDFAVISGRDNFKQVLKNRVETERGELIFHMDYGSLCRRLIGAVNGPTTALLAGQYAKASLLADPRVSAVDKAIATVTGDQIALDLEVIPVVGRPIQLSAAP
jgi:phage baseplate assembly protein W